MREGVPMPEDIFKTQTNAPESDADAAAGIEDEMRAQLLLSDPRQLEDYLRVGFQTILEKSPKAAAALQERAAKLGGATAPVEALAQETRLRLTALTKTAPEQVSGLEGIVRIMFDQFKKRTGTIEKTEVETAEKDMSAEEKKMIWDKMMEEAHQSKKG